MRLETIAGGIILVALLGAGIYYIVLKPESSSEVRPSEAILSAEEKERRYQKAPELVSSDGYINTGRNPDGSPKEITIGEFKGKKVVLVDIWTYSCINCQRTFPYLRAWYEKYKDHGLEIIAVHTPEFAFEQVYANVENAAKEFGLTYPIVQDNEYRTWNAFGNRFWPRKYLIDIDGYIVYDHAGEGSYEETERAIQRALAERAQRLGLDMSIDGTSEPEGVVEVKPGGVRSPETYFGAARNDNFGNGTPFKTGPQTLSAPSRLIQNVLYLDGTWDLTDEYARNTSPGAKITFIYNTKDVYFVASAGKAVRVKVLVDGKPVGNMAGADVAADSTVTIQEERLYKIIEGAEYGQHTLEMIVEWEGLEAYTFTFG